MINRTRLKIILREEAERVFHEAEAHEDDLIHRAYLGLDTSSDPIRTGSNEDNDPEDDETSDEPEQVVNDEVPDEPVEVSEEDVNRVKKGLLRRFNDSKIVDFGLDVMGTVGGYLAAGATAGSMGIGAPPAYTLAAVPDLVNSVRHAARGENFDAAIYFLCALPVIGEVLGPVKISMKLLGTAARTVEVVDMIDRIRSLIKGLKAMRTAKNASSKIKEVCEKYFPDFDSDSIERDAFIILEGSDDEVDDLLRRNGYIDDESDDEVSTEASPLSELKKDRYVSIILESSKSSKSSSKKREPLPPIPSTVEFEREMRDMISAYHAGEDIEAWLTHDILGSKANPHGLSRKTGWSGDEDFYRKPAASYIAQHLATNRDPELRAIGQRVLRKMGERIGSRRFSSMGSGFGLEPIEDFD